MGDEEYIRKILGGVIEYNQLPTIWNVAVSMDNERSWSIASVGVQWYVITEKIMRHTPIPDQPGIIGPFDTVQEAGTAWLLLGSPKGSN